MKQFLYPAFLSLAFAGCTHYDSHPVTDAELQYNVAPELVQHKTRHSPFSVLEFQTNAPFTIISAHTTFTPSYLSSATVSAYVNGKYDSTFTLTKQEEQFRLNLPAEGLKRIELVEGKQQNALEQGPLEFTSLTSVELPAGASYNVSPAKSKPTGLFVFADSRGHGGGYPAGSRFAWPVQLRTLRPTTAVYVGGYSSLQLVKHIDTAAKRAKLTQEISSALQRHAQQLLWIETGVNDYYNALSTPAQLTTFYRKWLQELHVALPQLRIIVQTDVVRKEEQANKLGFTLQDYRDGEKVAAKDLDFVQVQDGRPLTKVSDLPDGTHLSSAADTQFAHKVDSILTLQLSR